MVESSGVRVYNGVPTLFLDDAPEPMMVAYVHPEHMGSFVKAGFKLYTVTMPKGWWLGPQRYDFSAIDKLAAMLIALNASVRPR